MCPYVDAGDPRCNAHMTMREISTAFAYCFGRYTKCPVYCRRVARERQNAKVEEPVELLAAS